MKLFEILTNLFEYKGEQIADAYAGYIHSQTGEIIEIDHPDDPHVTLVAKYPNKFQVPPNMKHMLPPPDDEERIEDWAVANDSIAGPFQHIAYSAGWVRYFHARQMGFSGYKEPLVSVLSMPGVIRALVKKSKEQGTLYVDVDIIDPTKSIEGSGIGSAMAEVKSTRDIAALRDEVMRS